MPQYIISYLGGNQPSSPEEGKMHFVKYQGWLVSLGEVAISPMNPFMESHTIKPDGSVNTGSSTKMSGFTIIQADSMDKALEIAKACPFLEIGGSLEVSELVRMPGDK